MTIIARSLEGYSADVWANLPWRLFEKRLVRLQRRIHKASKAKNIKLVKALQHLLLGSNSARYLSVRYAVEGNIAKTNYCYKNYTVLTSKQKIKLVYELKYPRIIGFTDLPNLALNTLEDYLHNLKLTSLQCLFKYAIEPVSEFPSAHYFYKGQLVNSFHVPKFVVDFLPGHVVPRFLDLFPSCWFGQHPNSFLTFKKLRHIVFVLFFTTGLGSPLNLIKRITRIHFHHWYFKTFSVTS